MATRQSEFIATYVCGGCAIALVFPATPAAPCPACGNQGGQVDTTWIGIDDLDEINAAYQAGEIKDGARLVKLGYDKPGAARSLVDASGRIAGYVTGEAGQSQRSRFGAVLDCGQHVRLERPCYSTADNRNRCPFCAPLPALPCGHELEQGYGSGLFCFACEREQAEARGKTPYKPHSSLQAPDCWREDLRRSEQACKEKLGDNEPKPFTQPPIIAGTGLHAGEPVKLECEEDQEPDAPKQWVALPMALAASSLPNEHPLKTLARAAVDAHRAHDEERMREFQELRIINVLDSQAMTELLNDADAREILQRHAARYQKRGKAQPVEVPLEEFLERMAYDEGGACVPPGTERVLRVESYTLLVWLIINAAAFGLCAIGLAKTIADIGNALPDEYGFYIAAVGCVNLLAALVALAAFLFCLFKEYRSK